MGNGTTFTIWKRTVAPTRAEVEYYLSAFAEEDARTLKCSLRWPKPGSPLTGCELALSAVKTCIIRLCYKTDSADPPACLRHKEYATMDKKNTPEVKLGQYKGLAVTRHVRPVTDKTVDIELVHQTRMHAVYHPTTEPAKRGFRALLDFAGYMDGKEIPDSRMEKVMVVLGDGKLMPAAEQAIYGHRAGEVFRFDFTYPQDFRLPELSGKTAQFEIELRSLAEKVTPAPDEAFAKSLGFDSLDALKADLRAKKCRRSTRKGLTAPPASSCWTWPVPT